MSTSKKKVGTNILTKAAKEQLRKWPSQWSLCCDMKEILEFLETDNENGRLAICEMYVMS